jgi:hypothetical protein
MLDYIMYCYFLHQETHAKFEEQCKCYEAQLEKEGHQHNREMHNLSIEEENVWREIEVSCLHT